MNEPVTAPGSRVVWLKIAILFAVAFSLSAVWVKTGIGFNPRRQPDAALFEGVAANLADGHGYSYDTKPPYRPELTRSPCFPALASLVYRLFGRDREAVFWMNAVFVSLAVVLGYVLARRLFRDERAAWIGACVMCLTPQVSGSSDSFLSEPLAMFLIVLIALVALRAGGWRDRPWEAAALGGLGLLMAALVLARANFTVPVLVATGWVSFSLLRGRWRSPRAWAALLAFSVTLGGPVLAWSARNASVGLSFAPMPAGGAASYVYETKRFADLILDPDEQVPMVNRVYWSHYRKHLGPKQILEIERENRVWFKNVLRRHWNRILLATPWRVVNLFSNPLVCVYDQPWPNDLDEWVMPRLIWVSRVLWLLSFVGFLVAWRRKEARWVWLASVGILIPFHLLTVCHYRYSTSLLPLAMPYCGVAVTAFGRFLVRRFRRR
ncbi:MAG: glycosyltransferase family 39 protein [Deltaproteobacteria bacterium]|nr:glycosyltransferase family 39 protein [Deltaproteobacteria bacterium]